MLDFHYLTHSNSQRKGASTLLPTCWMFRNTDFHFGLRSFFMTSVLQIGIEIPPSTIFDITRKGSCKISQNIYQLINSIPHNTEQREENSKEKENNDPTGPYTSWEEILIFQIWTPEYYLHCDLWTTQFLSMNSKLS